MPITPQSRRRGLGWVRVRGRSMLPTLRDGDVLLVRWGAVPRPGDLVVVDLPGDRPLSVKRLAREEDGGWWVERDSACEGVDSWHVGALPRDAVHAVVLLRRPRLRRRRGRAAQPPPS